MYVDLPGHSEEQEASVRSVRDQGWADWCGDGKCWSLVMSQLEKLLNCHNLISEDFLQFSDRQFINPAKSLQEIHVTYSNCSFSLNQTNLKVTLSSFVRSEWEMVHILTSWQIFIRRRMMLRTADMVCTTMITSSVLMVQSPHSNQSCSSWAGVQMVPRSRRRCSTHQG